MTERAPKRSQRASSGSDDSDGVDVHESSYPSAAPTASAARPRRAANQPPPAAFVERSSPDDSRQSMNLTVKASPNKLRKAISAKAAKTAVTPQNIVAGKRVSRTSRVVREIDSDEDEDEDEEPDAMDVDDDEDDDEEEDDDDDDEDVDAEGEEDDDVDAEGDEDDEMDDVTPAPRIVISNDPSRKAHNNTSKPQDSVEAKELVLADDDDDEELSELESDEEVEDEDAEGEDEDAEGEEDDELPVRVDEEDDDMEMDSEDGNRSLTPDLSKLTRRQRAMHVEDEDGSLLALSNEAQKKKHLTAEEHAMRRAEMARRRKNLSEKRTEEEKMNTIDRLLKKQPPKRGKRLQEINSGDEYDGDVERANPLYVRYIQNAAGTRMGVPDEWLQAPAGSVFAGPPAKPSGQPFGRRMVEEVA